MHPGAPEMCNGRDDDCDGVIDEGDAVDAIEFYIDADHDGYGDAAHPVDACTQPPGTSLNENDCDDTRASVNPGAMEIAGNHIDDNCNGLVDEP